MLSLVGGVRALRSLPRWIGVGLVITAVCLACVCVFILFLPFGLDDPVAGRRTLARPTTEGDRLSQLTRR